MGLNEISDMLIPESLLSAKKEASARYLSVSVDVLITVEAHPVKRSANKREPVKQNIFIDI
jgi:hypothetical protein